MSRRWREIFTTVRTEGGLLPPDLLAGVSEGDKELGGLGFQDYHLAAGERINEAVTRAWNRVTRAWAAFQTAAATLPEKDLGTSFTRERWLLVLFQELGFGRLQASRGLEVGGKHYPISHFWQSVPIHLVGFRVDLDRRTAGVAGAARTSPHGLVQEFLNRSQAHLWGMVSSGLRLRILRDNASLTRQAFVEFDLEAMMEGEVYADFVLLWLLCHESRFEGEKPENCWLERWSGAAREQGTRALEDLRHGVEDAIRVLGSGFLAHPANAGLRDRLRSGALATEDYYRQLLRLAYRLIFLFVAEDRNLLFDPKAEPVARERYARYYSASRLRRLAERQRGTKHADLYQGLRVVMDRLGSDEGCPPLGLPALGSFLWSPDAIPDLGTAEIANHHLLSAVRALAFMSQDRVLRAVDYKNLGAEELGSVYESLLELHPEPNTDAATFELKVAAGHERKTTGSYYTPSSLVQCLLDSALDPVLDEAARKPDPERAILSLKVCDPACGSGHFLIAAAHRIAKRLAAIRTGDEEPSPEATRRALRDGIGHCLYGVDVNPMAVELCKVSLWMEALEPGKPLSFLDHRILCGNSLLGTTPALIDQGIPDEAFQPIEGDDKKVASALRKRNRQEREGQITLPLVAEPQAPYGSLAHRLAGLDAIPDDTITGIHEKEFQFRSLEESFEYQKAHLAADAWCVAFAWKKTGGAPPPLTHDVFVRIQRDPASVPASVGAEIKRLKEQYHFFHWHLAFPDVFQVSEEAQPENQQAGWTGGFDVVLGNPPWEHTELKEKEWFATRRPDIADARTADQRKQMIKRLAEDDPLLLAAFQEAKRQHDAVSHFMSNSDRYPLCGRGRINTYAVFAETKRMLISQAGRVGTIVPSGIATDDTTKFFFQDLMGSRSLVSLYDFENREKLFPAVDSRMKFCLLTITGPKRPAAKGAEFVFFAHRVEDLREEERRVVLSAEDIALLNPNTCTCPIFRSKRDAEITKAIYCRIPVLVKGSPPEENTWGVTFMQGLFNMASASGLFRTREHLEGEGWVLEGNVFTRGEDQLLPLYEAKMIHHFDHRWATYDGEETRELSTVEKADPNCAVLPRYWVSDGDVQEQLERRDREGNVIWTWDSQWFLGWRRISNTTNERTFIFGLLPLVAAGDSVFLFLSHVIESTVPLLANLTSFAFDFVVRQKMGGTNLNFYIVEQLPILSPTSHLVSSPWNPDIQLKNWFHPRVRELTYTAWDLEPFARDCGYHGPPFRWDEERRFLLRCELDAAFFHLYGIARDDVDYIMETFPIVKRKDEDSYGEYRTKRVILEIFDTIQKAIETGVPYQTVLDPPPAAPRVAHPPREKAAALVVPFRRVHPRREEKYQTCVPLLSLKVAAGGFSDDQAVQFEDWVDIKTSHRLRKGMFVAQVVGRSMEPVIPDGSYCLFCYPVLGTRQGKILLVQYRDIHDPETGGSYTVKRYSSEKVTNPDGTWHHTKVILSPLNPDYEPIVLTPDSEDAVQVIAEFLDVP